MNNWIYHLKDYANENGISYAEAVKDPKCRKEYYANLGKKVPNKVKKVVKVQVDMLEPSLKERMDKIKKEIKVGLKPVKVALKKNVIPDF